MDPIARMVAAGAAGAAGGGDPTYVDDVFSTFLYEGSNSTQSIDNGIDLSGESGLVWIKNRSNTSDHALCDTERGATKVLQSNTNYAEATNSLFSSFNSNGFTIAGNSNVVSRSGYDYTSWTFRKAPGFFDVVTYTGNGTAGRTVSHSLDSQPGMMLIKKTNGNNDWAVYHRGEGNGYVFALNDDINRTSGIQYWNNTHPSSTQFTLGTDDRVNANGDSYVAYLFAHDDQRFGTNSDESIVKCGWYAGSSSSGKFIDVGFEPQWIMIKKATDAGNDGSWLIFDAMRGIASGYVDEVLKADLTSSEQELNLIELNPTGFTLTTTDDSVNSQFRGYLYMAIRRPHKPPTAGTEVYNSAITASDNDPVDVGFPTDLHINASHTGSYGKYWTPRLTNAYQGTHSPQAEGTNGQGYIFFDQQNTFLNNFWTGNSNTVINWYFRRAPGFLDVVTYTGTGSNQTVNHNLGVVPELIIIKKRSSHNNWHVFVDGVTSPNSNWYQNFGSLNGDSQFAGFAGAFSSAPTSTALPLGSGINVGDSGVTYIGYLFGTLSGISKVGTYSGTGSNINVDCGFTSGARFIMIKRTDSTGNWYVWDSTRGIASGNDTYLRLNTDGESAVTNTDYIDPLNAGFTVTSSAPAELNANGGTYLFLAIA